VNEFRGRRSGPHEELQPFRPLAAGADFAAAKEIALRDDADELARIIHDRQAADMGAQHDVGGILDLDVRRHGDDVPGHDVVGAHERPPLCSMLGAVWTFRPVAP
jgi:hypothetical protein